MVLLRCLLDLIGSVSLVVTMFLGDIADKQVDVLTNKCL